MADTKNILVIEDNPADVRLIQEALGSVLPKVALHVVRDGEEAFRFLSRAAPFCDAPRPVLVLLDFHLPKTDPGEVLKFIKQQEQLREIPVVVLTTSNSEELIRQAYRLGANCYLLKPSDLDSFFWTIQSAVKYWLNAPVSTNAHQS